MSEIEYWELSNGVKIPAVGFGIGSSWRLRKAELGVPPDYVMPELVETVESALEIGFDHIDSAEIYLTRKEFATGLKNKGVDRTKIFYTDKHFCGVPVKQAFTSGPTESLEIALKQLDTDYIDLYLLHSASNNYKPEYKKLSNIEQWEQLEKAYKEGKVKAIGVSNYSTDKLESLINLAEIKPMALQIEYHAMCQDKSPGIIELCKKHNIQVSAYAPLAPLTLAKEKGTFHELLELLAKKYNKSEAQILLRWVSQSGVIPVTTLGKPHRLREARDIFSFKLSEEDYNLLKEEGLKSSQTFYKY